jgi:hypothetical protein
MRAKASAFADPSRCRRPPLWRIVRPAALAIASAVGSGERGILRASVQFSRAAVEAAGSATSSAAALPLAPPRGVRA